MPSPIDGDDGELTPQQLADQFLEEHEDRLAADLIGDVEDTLAIRSEAEEIIAARIEHDLAMKVAKRGSLMAYRREVRRAVASEVVSFPSVSLTDIDRLSRLQIAVAKWVDLERWIVLRGRRGPPEGEGTAGVVDEDT